MARFKTGKQAHEEGAVKRSGGGFTPVHKFEAGANNAKYLQFLTSWDEIATVEMHQYIIVGEREDGSDIFEEFIVGKDDETGEYAYDPIKDRFGLKPKQRRIGIAVELIPDYDTSGTRKVLKGWDIAEREWVDKEGNKQVVPNVALVNESPFTFYGHLAAFDDEEPIESVVFRVIRTGTSTDTDYTLIKAGDAIEGLVDDPEIAAFFEEFDFVKYLESKADDDRMHELIDHLPDNAVLSRYQDKKRKKDDKAAGSNSARSRRSAPEPESDPEAAEEPGDEEAASTAPARSRRFSALHKETAAK